MSQLSLGMGLDPWSLLCLSSTGKGAHRALQAASWPLPGPPCAWNPSSASSSYSSALRSTTLSLGCLPCPESQSGAPSSTTAACITPFLSVLSVWERRGRVLLTCPSPSAQHRIVVQRILTELSSLPSAQSGTPPTLGQ